MPSQPIERQPEPNNGDAELGMKIRALRSGLGMTLKDLAEAAGVSQSLVSQIERGVASPSITTVRRLTGALNVPVATLFLEKDQSSSPDVELEGERIVVRKDERKGLHVPKSRVRYELLTPDLNRQIEFLWIEYSPGSSSHPALMSHRGEENALCLSGSIVVTVEGSEFVLNAGDSISFDSNRAHNVENRGSEPAAVISAITPPAF